MREEALESRAGGRRGFFADKSRYAALNPHKPTFGS
jgi:hypothetical protein